MSCSARQHLVDEENKMMDFQEMGSLALTFKTVADLTLCQRTVVPKAQEADEEKGREHRKLSITVFGEG